MEVRSSWRTLNGISCVGKAWVGWASFLDIDVLLNVHDHVVIVENVRGVKSCCRSHPRHSKPVVHHYQFPTAVYLMSLPYDPYLAPFRRCQELDRVRDQNTQSELPRSLN